MREKEVKGEKKGIWRKPSKALKQYLLACFCALVALNGVEVAYAADMQPTQNVGESGDLGGSGETVPQNNEPVYYEPKTEAGDITAGSTEPMTIAPSSGNGQNSGGDKIIEDVPSDIAHVDDINAVTDNLSFGSQINISVSNNPVSKVITNILGKLLSYAIPIVFGYFGLTLICDMIAAFTGVEELFNKSKKLPLLSSDFSKLKERKYWDYAKSRMFPIAFFVAGLAIVSMDLHLTIGGYLAKLIVYIIMISFNAFADLLNSFAG